MKDSRTLSAPGNPGNQQSNGYKHLARNETGRLPSTRAGRLGGMRSVAVKQGLEGKADREVPGGGVDRGGRPSMRLADASTQELEEALLLRRELRQQVAEQRRWE